MALGRGSAGLTGIDRDLWLGRAKGERGPLSSHLFEFSWLRRGMPVNPGESRQVFLSGHLGRLRPARDNSRSVSDDNPPPRVGAALIGRALVSFLRFKISTELLFSAPYECDHVDWT